MITEAKFLGQMEIAPASQYDTSRWMLVNPVIYQSVVAQQIFIVPRGFVTDLASVPRIVPFAYALFGNTSNEAAVVHDYLYSAPHSTTREMADAVLREASAVTRVAAWRRWPMWLGVRVFGWLHWR
jgi:hypothetical protein